MDVQCFQSDWFTEHAKEKQRESESASERASEKDCSSWSYSAPFLSEKP